jgi:ankyrin repeat protein
MSTMRSFFNDLHDAVSPPPEELGQRLLTVLRQSTRGDRRVLAKIESLLDKGADLTVQEAGTGCYPLTVAAIVGNPDIIAMILKKNPALDAKGGGSGWTPLIAAGVNGRAEAARLLLKAGCNIDAVDDNGRTALDHARQRATETGCDDCVKVLEGFIEQRKDAQRQAALQQAAHEAYLNSGMPTTGPTRILKPLTVVRRGANRNR